MHVFICTKPLQIMVAMMLREMSVLSCLYVVNSFDSAMEVSRSPELAYYFDEINFFGSRETAIHAARKHNVKILFVDSDMGLRTHFSLLGFKLRRVFSEIHVYEEGLGTYRDDIVATKAKRIFYRVFGAPICMGGGIVSKNIHVFDISEHNAKLPQLIKKSVPITRPLSEFVKENEASLTRLFSPGFSSESLGEGEEAYIYLSDWTINFDDLKKIQGEKYSFLKPHPHIDTKELKFLNKSIGGIRLLPASLPAELVLLVLSGKFNKVHVLHKGSSTMRYLVGEKNILHC